jgi:histidinol-phosphatase
MAAVAIIVTESGGRFSDLENVAGPFGKSGVSTNGHLHNAFISAVNA